MSGRDGCARCANVCSFRMMQMLWWGMDETLAELFAQHPSAEDFEGNPMGSFRAEISGRAYGPDRTPRDLGLYGGRYTVVFRPGKSLCCLQR